jgi:hypothetical protein
MLPQGFFFLYSLINLVGNLPRIDVVKPKTKNSIITLPKRFRCVIAKVLRLGNYGKTRENFPNLFHTLQNKNVAL